MHNLESLLKLEIPPHFVCKFNLFKFTPFMNDIHFYLMKKNVPNSDDTKLKVF